MTNRNKMEFINKHTSPVDAMHSTIDACTRLQRACADIIRLIEVNHIEPDTFATMLVKSELTRVLVALALLERKGFTHDTDIADSVIDGMYTHALIAGGDDNANRDI